MTNDSNKKVKVREQKMKMKYEEKAQFLQIVINDAHDLLENDEPQQAKEILTKYGVSDVSLDDVMQYLNCILGDSGHDDAAQLAARFEYIDRFHCPSCLNERSVCLC